MKIEKLPSGSYRVRQQIDGKRYTITLPYKPTEKEAYRLLQEKASNKISKEILFKDAATEYINAKKNVLSPRSVREYRAYIRRLPSWFTEMDIYQIDQFAIQKCINELAIGRAPKTVSCYHGFITPVMDMFRPEMVISTTLPQKVQTKIYIPTNEEVRELLLYTKENAPHFYAAIYLGSLSLRRAEICALTIDNLKGTELTINTNRVQDENDNWVDKSTKTTTSERTIQIPQELADWIRSRGCIYDGAPGSISNYMKRTQKKLGMPEFSLHKTRHYFASVMLDEGYDMKTIEEWGGWAGPETLSKIYQHSMKMKQQQAKIEIANKFSIE